MTAIIGEYELGYQRQVYLAVQLLDAVTLTPIREGVEVSAEGLRSKPIINASGYFVWLREENGVATKVMVDPKGLPYEKPELVNATFPVTTIELQPRVVYEFAAGVTGLRGTLIERRTTPVVPVGDAEVRLSWLVEHTSDRWEQSPTRSRTEPDSGDFVSVLRLQDGDNPKIDADELTVRLLVRRGGLSRQSANFNLPQGRVTNRSMAGPLTFAWGDLQP